MGPSKGVTNSPSKPTVGSFQRPVPIDASIAALSTAAAVAAMRTPTIASTASSINTQGGPHSNTLVPVKRMVNQVFPQHQQPSHGNVPQHHLVLNPINLSPAYPLPNKYSTPSVFTNMKLRRGKWTQEEEAFANALIEGFEKGTIQDCGNGCTLRAFLSRKLHCAPMRISKKYAGKSIGKHVFLSRSQQPPQYDTPKLRRLEFQFHMSLVQEGSPRMEHDNVQLGQALLSANEFNPMMTGYPMAFRPNVLTNEAGTAINVQHHCHGLSNQPAVFQWPIAAGPPASHSAPNIASTMQMQHSLYTVFKDAHKLPLSQTSSLHTPAITQASTHPSAEKGTESVLAVVDQISTGMPTQKNNTGNYGFVNTSNRQYNSMTNARVSTHAMNNGLDQRGDNSMPLCLETTKQKCLEPIPVTRQECESLNSDVKLFKWSQESKKEQLSGDSLSSLNTLAPTANVLMDDLDFSMGGTCTTTSSININPPEIDSKEDLDKKNISESWTDFPISAEEYALFAQESAMAVSKHSAYCTGDIVGSDMKASLNTPRTDHIFKCGDAKVANPSKSQIAVMDDLNICKSSLHPPKENRQVKSLGNNGAAFNATNLQIHLRAAEEKARVDQASKDTRDLTCNSTKHSPMSIGESSSQVNLISGSEQSSDMSANGGEGSTGNSCSGCGSDNASDDFTSDETIHSGAELKGMSRKHKENYNACHGAQELGDPQGKRQKRAVMVVNVCQQ